MGRTVLTIELIGASEDAKNDLEHYVDVFLCKHRYRLRRYELEDGDDLLKLSVAKDAIVAGFAQLVETVTNMTPEQRRAMALAEELATYRSPPADLVEPRADWGQSVLARLKIAEPDRGCPGGCSRGGEGPPCGRPGCY